jgi:hypothetical protein
MDHAATVSLLATPRQVFSRPGLISAERAWREVPIGSLPDRAGIEAPIGCACSAARPMIARHDTAR